MMPDRGMGCQALGRGIGPRARWGAVALGLALAACGADEPVPAGPALSLRAFAIPPEGAPDPLADHRPEGATCPGWWFEEGLLEADTDLCDYLTVVQPFTRDVAPGAVLSTGLSHDDLFPPAEAADTAEPADTGGSDTGSEGTPADTGDAPTEDAAPHEAHVALWIDEAVVWEVTLRIPGPARFHQIEVPLDDGAASGSRLGLHLHNHGANSYRLLPLTLDEGEAAPAR